MDCVFAVFAFSPFSRFRFFLFPCLAFSSFRFPPAASPRPGHRFRVHSKKKNGTLFWHLETVRTWIFGSLKSRNLWSNWDTTLDGNLGGGSERMWGAMGVCFGGVWYGNPCKFPRGYAKHQPTSSGLKCKAKRRAVRVRNTSIYIYTYTYRTNHHHNYNSNNSSIPQSFLTTSQKQHIPNPYS